MKRPHGRRKASRIEASFMWTCGACGKQAFPSRKRARAKANQMADPRLQAFRCKESKVEVWHLGHVPDCVKDGDVPRSILVNRPNAKDDRRSA